MADHDFSQEQIDALAENFRSRIIDELWDDELYALVQFQGIDPETIDEADWEALDYAVWQALIKNMGKVDE